MTYLEIIKNLKNIKNKDINVLKETFKDQSKDLKDIEESLIAMELSEDDEEYIFIKELSAIIGSKNALVTYLCGLYTNYYRLVNNNRDDLYLLLKDILVAEFDSDYNNKITNPFYYELKNIDNEENAKEYLSSKGWVILETIAVCL